MELGQRDRQSIAEIQALLKQSWIEGSFTEAEEKGFLHRHGNVLTHEDHVARTSEMLWQGNTDQAQRMLDAQRVSSRYRTLFTARIKLTTGERGVDAAIQAIKDDTLHKDPGLIYARMTWRYKRKDYGGVLELLWQLSSPPPHPEKWWPVIHDQARTLVKQGRMVESFALVRLVADNPDFSEGVAFAESQWTAGWLALRFLDKPKMAYDYFYRMYNGVTKPVSLARAAYWTGRAAERGKQYDLAQRWYQVAANYPTTFYGQLAVLSVPNRPFSLPRHPTITRKDEARYHNNAAAKIAHLLFLMDRNYTGHLFLQAAVGGAQTASEVALVSRYGLYKDEPKMTVETSKFAASQGVILPYYLYPLVPGLDKQHPLYGLVHGIIRQESVFDTSAQSGAGASGLMQLMPGTARDVAKKIGIDYIPKKLTRDMHYNVTLGGSYINEMLDYYNGSLVLAIAAYNAGPGSVNEWLKVYGDPREMQHVAEVIDWLELIPFRETRNYTQRVLENTHNYYYLLQKPLPMDWMLMNKGRSLEALLLAAARR